MADYISYTVSAPSGRATGLFSHIDGTATIIILSDKSGRYINAWTGLNIPLCFQTKILIQMCRLAIVGAICIFASSTTHLQ